MQGIKLQEIRYCQRLSRRKVAEKAQAMGFQISEGQLERWEMGRSKVPLIKLKELAAVYGCDYEELKTL